MTPQDVRICLGEEELQTTPPKPQEATDFKKVAAPRPTFISERELEQRIADGAPQSLADGVPVVGDVSKYTDANDIPLRVVSHCVKLDLSEETDRRQYAELYGKAGDPCSHLDVVWEKQVIHEDKLIIYVTYTETLRVSDE